MGLFCYIAAMLGGWVSNKQESSEAARGRSIAYLVHADGTLAVEGGLLDVLDLRGQVHVGRPDLRHGCPWVVWFRIGAAGSLEDVSDWDQAEGQARCTQIPRTQNAPMATAVTSLSTSLSSRVSGAKTEANMRAMMRLVPGRMRL